MKGDDAAPAAAAAEEQQPPADEPGGEPNRGDEVEQPRALSIVEALSAVMGEVQSVSKSGRNTQQNYNFRGVDAVVNAVGPALRKHGVVVVPIRVEYDVERYQTRSGAEMKGVTAVITFRFYGPAGDYIDAQAAGESSDAGDKAMPKAHSVSYRTLLLQALCIPTDEPDPDSEAHERAPGSAAEGPRTRGQRDARPKDKSGQPFDLPKDWRQLAEVFEREFVDPEWLNEAIVSRFGVARRELSEEDQGKAGALLREMYVALMQIVGPSAFPGAKRAELRAAFAAALEGVELEGPPWRIHPPDFDEGEAEYPTREEYDAEHGDGEPESAEDAPLPAGALEADAADDDIPFGDEAPGGGYE